MTRLATTLLVLALALGACAKPGALRPGTDSSGEMTAAPEGGVTMLYRQDADAVFQAAFTALVQVGLHVVETDPNRRYILAERGVTAWSYGENVGVYLAPQPAGTRVTVTSKRKLVTNITAKDWTMPVHVQLGAVLGGQGQR